MNFNYLLAEILRELAAIHQVLDITIIFFATAPIFLIPVILTVLYLKRGSFREDSLFIFIATALSLGLSYLVKLVHYQEAPFMIYETLMGSGIKDSFPSQHAATMFGFAIGLIYRKRNQLGYIFLGLAILNGLARVIVGEHFPLDIAVSAFLGLAAVQLIPNVEIYIRRLSSWSENMEDKVRLKLRDIV